MDGTAVEPPLKEEAPHHTCTFWKCVSTMTRYPRQSPVVAIWSLRLKWFPMGIRQYWYGDSKMTRNQFSVDGFRKHLTLRPQKHTKKQFWKHFTILQGSPKRWKIGVAETLTEYYCGSLFKVCNTETKYTLKLSSASRASRGAIFSKKKRIS